MGVRDRGGGESCQLCPSHFLKPSAVPVPACHYHAPLRNENQLSEVYGARGVYREHGRDFRPVWVEGKNPRMNGRTAHL
jgi:hypothetical protein